MNDELVPVIMNAQITGPINYCLCHRRPDGAPALGINEFAREYLAWPPFVAIRALYQRTVCTVLVCSRIGPLCRINTAGVVNIFQRLCDRIAFLNFRHVLGIGFVARPYQATRCRNSRQLNELASCNFTQGNLLPSLFIILWSRMLMQMRSVRPETAAEDTL